MSPGSSSNTRWLLMSAAVDESWRKQSEDWRAATRQAHEDAELRQVEGRLEVEDRLEVEGRLDFLSEDWCQLGWGVKKWFETEGVIGRYRQFDIYPGDLHRFPSYPIRGVGGCFSYKQESL